MPMSTSLRALRLTALLVLVCFAFTVETAKAQYYGGCGYDCGSYAVAPFYGCDSCGVGFSYAPAPVVVQPIAPCGGCGAYVSYFPYYAGYRFGGYYGGYRYGGYYGAHRWGPRRWGYRW
jgi:hypothetical protein